MAMIQTGQIDAIVGAARIKGAKYLAQGANPNNDIALNSLYLEWNVARQTRGLAGVSGATPAERVQPGCAIVNIFNLDNPYSFHPQGVSYVRGDGSVAFMSQDIDPAVYIAMVSRDGGESLSND